MAGRWKEVPLQPVPGDRNGGYTRHMPDYAPRDEDFEWAQRELGDVTMRIIDTDSVPVESLGREE